MPHSVDLVPAKQAPAPEAFAAPGRQTLSELLARILDQLSLSAWLPAGVLVFIVLLAATLRAAEGEVGAALAVLGDLSLASLLLLLGAVVLTTVLTQAFQFEAIRLLEGYWGPGRLRSALVDLRCRRHLKRRNALWREHEATADRAFRRARVEMLDQVSWETVEAATRLYRKHVSINALPAEQREQVEAHPWESYAKPALLRRMDSLAAAAEHYPEEDRAIRPTRLGNMLRSYEDPIEEQLGKPIEGFVQGIFHLLPAQIQGDHDHFRSRLDLYCSLVIVFLVGGLCASALLLGVDDRYALAAILTGILLSWLSYRAAVTSARAYGSFLTSLTQFAPDGAPTSA